MDEERGMVRAPDGTIGAIATTAAYDGGAAWFEGVMAYIERNIALVNEQMRTRFARCAMWSRRHVYRVAGFLVTGHR